VARSLVRSGLARAIPAHTTPPVRKLGRVKLNRLGDLRNLIGFSGSHEEQSFEWLTQKAALAQPLDNDLREVINIRQRHTEKMLKLQDKLTDPHDSRRPAQGATLNDVDRRAWVEAREAFVSRKLINDIGIRAIHAYIYFLAYRFIARNPSLVGKEKTLYQLATQHLIRIVFPRYDPRFALTTVITQECLGVFTRAVRKLVPEFHFVPFGQLGLAKKIRAEISTSQLSGDTAPKPEELAIKLRTPIHRIRLLLESLRRGRTVSSDVVVVQPTPTSDQPPQRSPSSVSQALSEARGKLERFSFAAIIAFRLLHDEIEPSSLSQVAELFGVSTEELTRRLEDERTQAREAKSPATDARRPKMRWADLDNLVPWLKALRGRDLVPAHRLVDSILNVERRWIEPAELAQLRDLTNADALIVIFLRQLWREPTLRIGDISIIKLLHASS